MSSTLESEVCCRLQVAPSGESYGGKRRPGSKQWQTTARYMAWFTLHHLRLTACTPGSAPGPTLGNEYGKALLFFTTSVSQDSDRQTVWTALTQYGSRECFQWSDRSAVETGELTQLQTAACVASSVNWDDVWHTEHGKVVMQCMAHQHLVLDTHTHTPI